MGSAHVAAGFHSCCGGIFERDYGDAHCDSWARSEHAQPRWEKRRRGWPIVALAWAGVARCGPRVFGCANQRNRAANAFARDADESFAAGSRRFEFGAEAIANSFARRKFPARFAN